jgi:hypothetical protein
MAAAKIPRTNTPTEQNKEDNSLVLYRLGKVEDAVKDLGKQVSGQKNITKADLEEFRTIILQRFDEKNAVMQKEVDRLDTEKADAKEVKDIRTLIKSATAFFTTILAAIIIYYLTTGRK